MDLSAARKHALPGGALSSVEWSLEFPLARDARLSVLPLPPQGSTGEVTLSPTLPLASFLRTGRLNGLDAVDYIFFYVGKE